MTPFIRQSSVDLVLASADIVEVVSGYTSLRKRGNTYLGLCPFHQEKTPSFTVSADKGLYYCFGCGEGGNIFTFLERAESLSFSEAVEQLGRRFGVPVEYDEGGKPDGARRDRETRLLDLLDRAAAFYQRYLWETESGEAARDYVTKRGFSREVCDLYRVGLAPDDWQGLHRRATKDGFTDRELDDAGLLVRQAGKAYDRFRGRLMFPLVDHRGRVVGFGGRTLKDESPKYLNSPEGPLYQKGQLLYGLYQARRSIAADDDVLVVEGYTDVMALAQAGVGRAVASMGTALTEAQLSLMTRFTRNVVFMFDADRAGRDAVMRSGELARRQRLRPLVAVLPGGQDPADLALREGAEGVRRVLGASVSLLSFEVGQILAGSDTSSPEGRVRAFEAVRQVLAKAGSLKEREELVEQVADRLRLTRENIAILLRELPRGSTEPAAQAGSRSTMAARSGRDGSPLGLRLLSGPSELEREFLVAAACNPSDARVLLDALTPEHFADSSNREVFEGLRDALRIGDAAQAMNALQAHAHGASDAGRLFVRVVLEADEGRYGLPVLEELHLRLQDAYLGRQISELGRSLEGGEPDPSAEKRLLRLQRLRQEVRVGLMGLGEV